MSQEDAQSIQSVDSIGLGDLDQPEESIPEEEEDGDQEAGDLDPRVQVELEKLNEATDVINKLETQLDEAKAAGRHAFITMTSKLQELAEQLGKCIQKARPYYESRVELKKAQTELQQAALLFEKANASLKASKEIVKLTEEGLTRQGGRLDETWQEMLNYATKKVAHCEGDVRLRQREHWTASKLCAETEIKVRLLEKKFKSAITKSKSYYELRSQMNHFVEKEKLRVHQLEQSISHAKSAYSEGLANLEGISEQIHLKRRLKDETQQRDSGCSTISDSASVAGSLDLGAPDDPAQAASSSSTTTTTGLPTAKQQAMLANLHEIFHQSRVETALPGAENWLPDAASQAENWLPDTASQTENWLPDTASQADRRRSQSIVSSHSVASSANSHSYPLLSALEKELNRLQVEQATTVPKTHHRLLETVRSVDSAMDSGSDCEDFDAPNDETIQGLHLEQTVLQF